MRVIKKRSTYFLPFYFFHKIHPSHSQKGRLAEVREMVEAGDWDINSHHMMSRTALHLAAIKSNVEAVKLLLEFHPDVKVRVHPTALPCFS